MRMLAILCCLTLGFARSVHADLPQTDDSHFIGHVSFTLPVTEKKVSDVASAIASEFKDVDKMLVRQDGDSSYGIDFSYKASDRSKHGLEDFAKRMNEFVDAKFGKGTLKGWNLSNSVIWIRK